MQDKPTIVFVHLNSKIPTYLKLNIRATSKLFPNQKIVLIHNQAEAFSFHSKVLAFKYNESVNANQIARDLNHPREFRNNFWYSSIARFDALKSYIEFSGESVLHVESDILLSKDFPMSAFACSEMRISYPVVAPNRGVASTLYIADLQIADKFVQFAVEYCNQRSSATDMEILADFAISSTHPVEKLPHAPADHNYFRPRNSSADDDESSKWIEYFGGIFDGNDIGVYLFGSDPRNNRGLATLGNSIPGNYVDITQWKIHYDETRKFASINSNGVVIPIFSLHATSKEIFLFWKFTRNYIMKKRLANQAKFPYKKLNTLVFINMARQKILKSLKFEK